MEYDFSGWVTRNNVRCSDGRTILPDAFAHCDRRKVPLIWNHQHNDIDNVLGWCLLENRPQGVYGYASFNDSPGGEMAKKAVQHGDIDALSIYANGLKQSAGSVLHGDIREVSLVLAGANPGAHIDYVDLAHSESGNENEEAWITFVGDDKYFEELAHSDEPASEPAPETKPIEELQHSEGESKMEDKSVKEIFEGAMEKLSEDEQKAVLAVIGMAIEGDDGEDGGEEDMKHNVFEGDTPENTLSHAAEGVIIGDAKKYGSMKESFLAHAEEYGIDGIEWLFPEVHNLNPTPEFIKRDTGWVDKVFNGAKKSPFSRLKSVFADITEDDARAKGYMKGNYKKEEVFSLLKRTTQPTTIYKKQKMDRDDIIDLGNFDAISWLKTEMRMMLNEEIARAILVGDGRLASSDDKIREDCIRPIWKDEDFYTIKNTVEFTSADTDEAKTKKIINSIIRSRKFYKGSGNPTFFTTEDFVTDCLLLEDGIGHKLYKSVQELCTTLRVSSIETVEIMEGLQRSSGSKTLDLVGIIVNMNDYTIGADKGGSVNMFDDFDIDYNQQKYLIETRCSGSLIKPFSAIAVESYTVSG